MSVDVGQPLANFSAPMTGEQIFELEKYKGKTLLIYFYPKDNTPGCTQEGQDFRDHYDDFQSLNVEIFGVSRDSLRTHENFKAKHQFPFELISDKEEKLCQLFDVIKEKKLYGKVHMGIERSTFIIDDNGILIQQWRKVKVKTHIDEVLEFLHSR